MNLTLTGAAPPLLETYVLMFARCLGLVFTAPVLSSPSVPVPMRTALAGTLAFLLLPFAASPRSAGLQALLLPAVARELALGALLGFAAMLLFYAVHWMSDLVDFSLGFGFAYLADPFTQERAAVVGRVTGLALVVLFLCVDGLHALVRVLAASFQLVPVASAQFAPALASQIAQSWTAATVLALQLLLPPLAAAWLIDFASGLVGRVLPQMNVFLVTMPVKIVAGLLALLAALPVLTLLITQFLAGLSRDLSRLLMVARG